MTYNATAIILACLFVCALPLIATVYDYFKRH